MSDLTVFPPIDLSSDLGGDEDSPLPDQSLNEDDDEEVGDDEDQPEEDFACLQRAA